MTSSHALVEAEVREFVLRGGLHNARSEASAIAARFEPGARVRWELSQGRFVEGDVGDFLNMIAMAEVREPPPDPAPRLIRLEVVDGEAPTATATVHVTGRDGRRTRLDYRLVRVNDDWRIAALDGGYVDASDGRFGP